MATVLSKLLGGRSDSLARSIRFIGVKARFPARTMAVSETADLKRRVMAAVGWAAVTKFVGQALNWVITLIVIRILTPEDYGLMALTAVFLGFFNALTEAGFADSIVQSNAIGDEALRSLFGFVLAANLGLFIVLGLAAYPIAWFYAEPRLILLLQVAGINFLLLAFCTIPQARLTKALDLRRLTRVDLVANLAGGGLTVLVLALAGAGVWALLGGMLVTTGMRVILLAAIMPYFPRPSFAVRGMRAIFSFGATRVIEQMTWFLYNSSDALIVGKALGNEALGVYSVALNIATLPVTKISGIKSIAFPTFALVQDQRDKAVAYLIKAVRLLGLFSFPIFFGMSSIAPEFVRVFLGPKWVDATIPLQLIAAVMVLRVPALVMPSFLHGLGHVRASLNNTILGLLIFPVAFLVGSHWGVVGVAAAWAVTYPIFFLQLVWHVSRVAEVAVVDLLNPLLLPGAAASIMYGIVVTTRLIMPDGLSPGFELAVLVVSGAAVYAVVLGCFGRQVLAEATALLRH
jgi:O-antigen/teichoic acid export membrane protein